MNKNVFHIILYTGHSKHCYIFWSQDREVCWDHLAFSLCIHLLQSYELRIHRLVQERHISIANTQELRLSCTYPWICLYKISTDGLSGKNWNFLPCVTRINDRWGKLYHTIHYNDVIMGMVWFQIISLWIVYSTVYSGPDQRKHQSSMSLSFVRGIHWWPVTSLHKGPVTRKMFPFDDIILGKSNHTYLKWVVIHAMLLGHIWGFINMIQL